MVTMTMETSLSDGLAGSMALVMVLLVSGDHAAIECTVMVLT